MGPAAWLLLAATLIRQAGTSATVTPVSALGPEYRTTLSYETPNPWRDAHFPVGSGFGDASHMGAELHGDE
jgi:hypothetical protein